MALADPGEGKVLSMAPRLAGLEHEVVTEIASRLGVDRKIVLRAMLHVSLAHQSELNNAVQAMREVDSSGW